MNKRPFYDYFDDFDNDTESAEEFDVSTDSDAYYETTTTSPDAETADFDFPEDPDADAEFGNEFDPEPFSPDDELAATSDDGYCEQTVWAQQKCALDDYEIISDVLGSEKQLVKLYSTALCESAEEPLRDIIRNNLTECAQDQYATFKYMSERGMYPVEDAPEEKILQAKQQFTPLCDNDYND